MVTNWQLAAQQCSIFTVHTIIFPFKNVSHYTQLGFLVSGRFLPSNKVLTSVSDPKRDQS